MSVSLRELSLPHPGILATDFYDNFELHCYEPPEDLRPYIVHLWTQRPRTITTERPLEIQTGPETYLYINHEKAIVHGIFSKNFQYDPTDNTVYVGVKFRAGGFHAFYKQPMHQLAGMTLDATELFPELDEKFRSQLSTNTDKNIIEQLIYALRRASPVPHKGMLQAMAVLDILRTNATLLTVQSVAEQSAMSERRLQMLFREYVGVSPKWVLRRRRLVNVLLKMQSTKGPWVRIIAESSYADQAHFSREFTAITGISPKAYKAALAKRP